MPASLTLDDDELRELTARQRSNAQRRALDALGIPYRLRHDRSLVVLRSHVENLGGTAPKKKREPEMHL